ncbi:MAG TPA: methyltransferase domain-containing protein [Candidatus Polarisedimenticolaceae bacterium]|nr:methyltransferase domain-containing protein [Candidatus Polarisedimenticolaceae bacterium]
MDDSYRGIARHYDLHGWDWYTTAYGAQLVALLRARGLGPGARVLDAGCGTGSLALMLAREGFRVTAADLSADMIERARAKDAAGSVDWRVADLTAMDLGLTCDALVSVADVFNHFETLDVWETVLRRARAHLRPGGTVFVDAMTSHGLAQMDQQSVQERGGVTLILSIVFEPRSRRSTLKVTSFAPAGAPGLFERAQETISEWGQPVVEAMERFERAGFREVERVWSDAADPETSTRITIVARA